MWCFLLIPSCTRKRINKSTRSFWAFTVELKTKAAFAYSIIMCHTHCMSADREWNLWLELGWCVSWEQLGYKVKKAWVATNFVVNLNTLVLSFICKFWSCITFGYILLFQWWGEALCVGIWQLQKIETKSVYLILYESGFFVKNSYGSQGPILTLKR